MLSYPACIELTTPVVLRMQGACQLLHLAPSMRVKLGSIIAYSAGTLRYCAYSYLADLVGISNCAEVVARGGEVVVLR